MKKACLLISLVWLYWPSSPLEASFKEACGPDFRVGTLATTTDEIYETLCPLNLNGSKEAKELTEEVAVILRPTKESKPIFIADLSPEFKTRFKPAIDNLTTTLNQNNIDVNAEPSNELARLVYELIRRFRTAEERRRHFEDYKLLLQKILLQTEIGQQVTSCFLEEHPNISRIDVLSSQSHPGLSGFSLESDPNHEEKFIKFLFLDINTDPLNMVDLYLHEMKHGCEIDNKIALNREEKNLVSEQKTLDTRNEAQKTSFMNKVKNYYRKSEQYHVLDELRAYKTQSMLREELTTKVPRVFCTWLISGMLWGYALNTYAESGALMKDMIEEGTFAVHLIDLYHRLGMLHKESLYVQNEDGSFMRDANGALIFLPDFRQTIEATGFKLK